MAGEKSTLEQTVGGIKQDYTARLDSPNQFVPKKAARVARTPGISRDINALIGTVGGVVKDQTRITNEAVRKHATDLLASNTNSQINRDAGLGIMDDRGGAKSDSSAEFSATLGSNVYDDPEKQEIFDEFFTKPAAKQVSNYYNKWEKEQQKIDRINWTNYNNEIENSVINPQSGLETDDKSRVLIESIKDAEKNGLLGETFRLDQADKAVGFFEADYDQNPNAMVSMVVDANGMPDKEGFKNLFDTFYAPWGTYNTESGTIDWSDNLGGDGEVREKIMRSMQKFAQTADAVAKANNSASKELLKAVVRSTAHTGKEYQSTAEVGGRTFENSYVENDDDATSIVDNALARLNYTGDVSWLKVYFDDYRKNNINVANSAVSIASNVKVGFDQQLDKLNDTDAGKLAKERAGEVMATHLRLEKDMQEYRDSGSQISELHRNLARRLDEEYGGEFNGRSNTIITKTIAENILAQPGSQESYNNWVQNGRFVNNDSFKTYMEGSDMSRADKNMYYAMDAVYGNYYSAKRQNPELAPLEINPEAIADVKKNAQGFYTKEGSKNISENQKIIMDVEDENKWKTKEDLYESKQVAIFNVAAGTNGTKKGIAANSSKYITEFKSPDGEKFTVKLNMDAQAKSQDPLSALMGSTATVNGKVINRYANNLSTYVMEQTIASEKLGTDIIEAMENNGYMIEPYMVDGIQQQGSALGKRPGKYLLHYYDEFGYPQNTGVVIDLSVFSGTLKGGDATRKVSTPVGPRGGRR